MTLNWILLWVFVMWIMIMSYSKCPPVADTDASSRWRKFSRRCEWLSLIRQRKSATVRLATLELFRLLLQLVIRLRRCQNVVIQCIEAVRDWGQMKWGSVRYLRHDKGLICSIKSDLPIGVCYSTVRTMSSTVRDDNGRGQSISVFTYDSTKCVIMMHPLRVFNVFICVCLTLQRSDSVSSYMFSDMSARIFL